MMETTAETKTDAGAAALEESSKRLDAILEDEPETTGVPEGKPDAAEGGDAEGGDAEAGEAGGTDGEGEAGQGGGNGTDKADKTDIGESGAKDGAGGGAQGGADEATDADLKDLPDFQGNEAIKQAFIRERIKNRKALEAAQQAAARPAGEGAEAARGGGADVYEPSLENEELVFVRAAQAQRVLDGEVVEGLSEDQAEKVWGLTKTLRASMKNPTWCLEVLNKALQGQYGENSEAIADLARSELPVVQQRAAAAEMQAKQQETDAQRTLEAVGAEMQRIATEKYPALGKYEKGKESPEVLFVRGWIAQKCGTPQQPGPRMAELQDPKRLEGLFDDAMTAYQAEQFRRLQDRQRAASAAAAAEGAPMGGGGGAGTHKGPAPGSSEALSKILDG